MFLNIITKNTKDGVVMEYDVVCPICWKNTDGLLEFDGEYMCEECYLEESENEQEELA